MQEPKCLIFLQTKTQCTSWKRIILWLLWLCQLKTKTVMTRRIQMWTMCQNIKRFGFNICFSLQEIRDIWTILLCPCRSGQHCTVLFCVCAHVQYGNLSNPGQKLWYPPPPPPLHAMEPLSSSKRAMMKTWQIFKVYHALLTRSRLLNAF